VEFKDRVRLDLECTRVEKLLSSGVFLNAVTGEPNLEFWSVIIEILINLRDLCWFADKAGLRLSWKDDLSADTACKDVTGLIEFCRDGLCHSHTYHRFIDRENEISGIRNLMFGKGIHSKINGAELRSDHDDDIAIFIGKERLYLKRHIVRVFRELLEIFQREGLISKPVERFPPQSPAAEPSRSTTG